MRHPVGSRIETRPAAAPPISGDKRRWWVSDIRSPRGGTARLWTPGSRSHAESNAFAVLLRLQGIEQHGVYEWPTDYGHTARS